MSETNSLSTRIDAEFAAVEKKFKDTQVELLRECRQRRERLRRLGEAFEKLARGWQPRLQTLVRKFDGRVRVTPHITPSHRETAFEFESKQYRVRLRFSAMTDRDVSKVVLACDLEITPALFRYEQHAELEFPLDAVDEEAAGRWADDRIVEFVRLYLSMVKDELAARYRTVEDPVAHVRFPDFAAGATLEWGGERYYFIGEETRQEFLRQHEAAAAGQAGG